MQGKFAYAKKVGPTCSYIAFGLTGGKERQFLNLLTNNDRIIAESELLCFLCACYSSTKPSHVRGESNQYKHSGSPQQPAG